MTTTKERVLNTPHAQARFAFGLTVASLDGLTMAIAHRKTVPFQQVLCAAWMTNASRTIAETSIYPASVRLRRTPAQVTHNASPNTIAKVGGVWVGSGHGALESALSQTWPTTQCAHGTPSAKAGLA